MNNPIGSMPLINTHLVMLDAYTRITHTLNASLFLLLRITVLVNHLSMSYLMVLPLLITLTHQLE